MSLTSPIVNPITLKNLTGSYKNKWNTLHSDFKDGGWTVLGYCQKFPNGHVIPMQLISTDSDTAPVVTVTLEDLTQINIPVVTTNTIVGDITRYYFNYTITLGAQYYGKVFQVVATQGSESLTSEPVYSYDMSSELDSGSIRNINYTNYDRINADLFGNYIDWSSVPTADNTFDFFIECSTREPNGESEQEILQESESEENISSFDSDGDILKTGHVPHYMAVKLQWVSGLDYLEINGQTYLRKGIERSIVGGSTSEEVTLTLTAKEVMGLNVDDMGIINTDTTEWHKQDKKVAVIADFNITEPVNYITDVIELKHNASSLADLVTVKIGYTLGGSEIGTIRLYKSYTRPLKVDVGGRAAFDSSSTIYFTITGDTGYNLRIETLFQLAEI